jgi:hypothetical protein
VDQTIVKENALMPPERTPPAILGALTARAKKPHRYAGSLQSQFMNLMKALANQISLR